jgi:DNA polymerase IV
MGLSINKTVSKVATGEAKPNGRIHIHEEEVKPFFRPLPIRRLPMVGNVTHKFLQEMGIDTIGKLMDFPVDIIQRVMGKNGYSLWKKANGIDPSPVIPYSEAKSMSSERTLQQDTADVVYLKSLLLNMTEQLAYEMRKDNKMTGCISVKIRYSDFDTHTKQKTISYTSLDNILWNTVSELFDKLYERRLLIRLVGINFSHLVHANYQMQLFDENARYAHLMIAMDKIRNKYGVKAVARAQGK